MLPPRGRRGGGGLQKAGERVFPPLDARILATYWSRVDARSGEASWRSGYAEDCKSLHPGSIPGEASILPHCGRYVAGFIGGFFGRLVRNLYSAVEVGRIFPTLPRPMPSISTTKTRRGRFAILGEARHLSRGGRYGSSRGIDAGLEEATTIGMVLQFATADRSESSKFFETPLRNSSVEA